MDLIQTLEQEEITRLGKKIPDFAAGDTVVVDAADGELRFERTREPAPAPAAA